MKPSIGSYVTAKLYDKEDCRQGVLMAVNQEKSTIVGQLDTYVCESNNMVEVIDKYLDPMALDHVKRMRQKLKA